MQRSNTLPPVGRGSGSKLADFVPVQALLEAKEQVVLSDFHLLASSLEVKRCPRPVGVGLVCLKGPADVRGSRQLHTFKQRAVKIFSLHPVPHRLPVPRDFLDRSVALIMGDQF